MDEQMTEPINPVETEMNEAPVGRFITLIHDAYGEVSIPYDQLAELHPEVTVLRAMASASLSTQGAITVYVNSQPATLETILQPGDRAYVAGKLVGGK